ncbi:MAG: ABC transporter permease [Flavobacteriaceae bacterium]|nr:ABC transporter permease [Flavobacteriaceae bacterium]
MKFSFYIAKRYAFSKSKSKAINIITAIASLGIIVSAMAMFVVLSVFSGLREYSLSFTNQLDAELTLTSSKGKSFVLTPQKMDDLAESKLFSAVTKVVEDRLLFSFNQKQTVAYIKGVDDNYDKVSNFQESLEVGQWIQPNTSEAVVGLGIAHVLSMGMFDVEDAFTAIALKPGKGVIDNPEDAFIKKHLTPVGIYFLRNEDIDSKYVFTTLQEAQELLSLSENEVTNLEFRLAPGVTEKEATAKIQEVFGTSFVVKNRMQLNDSLYKMLNTENAVVYLIFLLVVIIALFNLIGALIMIILEKQSNIKTLNGLGMRMKSLRRIFLLQGLIISVLGGIIGIVLGSAVVVAQEELQLVMITEGLAYPVDFNFANVAIVFSSITVLGFIASYIASTRVNSDYLNING